MKFSSMLLYINEYPPTKQSFDSLLAIGPQLYRKGNFLYSVEMKYISDTHFWMYFQYDNENLYTDVVVDTTDNSAKNNPRPKTQVEMRNQLFACYDLKRQLLYVSDYQKKSTITDYIEDALQKSAMTKNVLKSLDEFAEAVKLLKSVTFTQRRNLYSITATDSIFNRQASWFGLDLPEQSKLKLDYGTTPIGIAKNTLQNWKRKHDNGEFQDIIIVGVDDAGFENTFNFSTTISSIEIETKRDENYRYNPDVVQVLLLSKLGA